MNRHLLFLLLALFAMPLTTVHAEDAPTGETVTSLTNGIYRIVSKTKGTVMKEENGGVVHGERSTELDYSELWVVERPSSSSYWHISTLASARYMQNESPVRTALLQATYFTIEKSTESGWFTILPTMDGKKYLNADQQTLNVVKYASATDNNSLWQFERIDKWTADEVKAMRDELNGWEKPTSGHYYTIISPEYNRVLCAGYEQTGGKRYMTTMDYSDSYTELWKVDGGALQSVPTSEYVFNQGTQRSKQYYTTQTKSTFTFTNNSSSDYLNTWAITASGGVGLHTSQSQQYWPVGWDTSADASRWIFQRKNLSDADVAEAQQHFKDYAELAENTKTLGEAMKRYFEDNACTQLKDEYKQMSDADLRNSMETSGLTEQFVDIALKIKNDTWADYEKQFRVADYMPYSDPNVWATTFNFTTFSRLTNPTGIHVKQGDVLLVFVDSVPSGIGDLKIEFVSGSYVATSGTTKDLKQGLNIIYADKDAATFIYYVVNTTAKSSSDAMASFPNIGIHIEGGRVEGMIDITRLTDKSDAEINEMYADMKKKGLFLEGESMQLKCNRITFNVNRQKALSCIGTEVAKLLKKWDWMIDNMYSLIGLEEYEGKWRNQFGVFTAYDGNYAAYATSRGTYYPLGSMQDALTYTRMLKSAGAIWTDAHENGHNMQHAINMAGMTEVSNNAFSNQIVYLQGSQTSRGDEFAKLMTNYKNGTFWTQNGIWLTTRMYYQLYMYFHIQKNDTTFYPRLFKALRADPMTRKAVSTGAVNSGTADYLKFAETCCKVANADLSEFFRAYGMFVPIKNFVVGDYSNYKFTTTEAQIQKSIAKMQAYEKKAGNILFIEDRIRQTPATYEGHAEGEMRQPFSSEAKNQLQGDVGQYEDYTSDAHPTGYSYQRSDSTFTINHSSATGAVGFKVYNKDGLLVAFSNTYKFTIPSKYANDDNLTIVAAGGDLSDVELSEAYNVYIYKGTEERVDTMIAAGEEMPENWVAKTKSSSGISDRLKQTTNVIVGSTCENMVIHDGADFYVPSVITARNLTYKHSTLQEYSPVCLPFAIKSDDLPFGSEICKLTSVNGTEAIFTAEKDAQTTAGHPFVIYSAQAPVEWTVEKTNARVVKAPVAETVDGATLNGTFATIGETSYLVPNDGCTQFVSATTVAPMRIYLDSTTPLNIVFQNTGTGIQSIYAEQNADLYDLQGRKTTTAKKGVYIVNGKKIVVK